MALPKPPVFHQTPGAPQPVAFARVDSAQVAADLQLLRQHIVPPMEEAKSLRWSRDFRFLGVLLLALFPLAAWTLFSGEPSTCYWCFSFYFSLLWALFFYHFFAPPGATRIDALIAYFGTGTISAVVLMVLLGVGLGKVRDGFLESPEIFVRIGANFIGVSLPEEICKAAVLFYFLFRKLPAPTVPTMVFYGLMSGFGIGIYLGMNYAPMATDATNAPSGPVAVPSSDSLGLLQLVALPFLEAVWTAIGAWFWTLGYLAPTRRIVLWCAAFLVPVLLHGLHSSFVYSVPWVSFAVDFVAVFAVLVFLFSGRENGMISTGNQPSVTVNPLPPLPPSGPLPPS